MLFSFTFSNLDKSTNILQWNDRSLSARLPSLQYLLSDSKCSITLFSKTWFLLSQSIYILNYAIYRYNRLDAYGGVAIVIYNSIKSIPSLSMRLSIIFF